MWQLKQLEQLYAVEPETVNRAIKELLDQQTSLREKLVIGAYLDGDINLGKAAELLAMHPLELRQQFLARGIPVYIGVASKEDIIAEGVAAKHIREQSK